ncbi:MAG: hypothetical protein B7Z31_02115 [Rhodobacterales bacterium 12-65-15]|nr:MAG: hypothetical protein B7Z31_02115 [Rhodobacterales bacterium 12-65-15]
MPDSDTKRRLAQALADLAEAPLAQLDSHLEGLCAPGIHWRGSHPLNERHGPAAIAADVWRPLKTALPDMERRDLICVGGSFEGRDYVAMVGHYCGTFRQDWLGIPATGRPVYLRYGEVHQLEDGRIVQSNCLWDVLDLIRQAGLWPVAPSLGVEGMWPGPITGDGLVFHATDPVQSAASIAQTLAMHGTLGAYDDLIGDGPYSVTGGWPSVFAMHVGPDFMGLPATGKAVTMRVMDFYLHHEGLIRENWVPLDVLDLLFQMGVDVLGRMKLGLGRG